MVKRILHYIGWRNWGIVTMNPILENTYVFLYIAVMKKMTCKEMCANSLGFILLSMVMFTYGYLLNDYNDISRDSRFRKTNIFSGESRKSAGVVVAISLLVTIVSPLPYYSKMPFVIVYVLWLIIASAYSINRIYLKGRGITGLIAVALALRTIPVCLAGIVFQDGFDTAFLFIAFYVTMRGIGADLSHQIFHLHEDVANNVNTFAVVSGAENAKKMLRVVFSIERLSLIVLIGVLSNAMYVKNENNEFWIAGILLGAMVFIGAVYSEWYILKFKTFKNPHLFEYGKKDAFYHMHKSVPKFILPLFILIQLALIESQYGIVLLSLVLYLLVVEKRRRQQFFHVKPMVSSPIEKK